MLRRRPEVSVILADLDMPFSRHFSTIRDWSSNRRSRALRVLVAGRGGRFGDSPRYASNFLDGLFDGVGSQRWPPE